MLQKGKRGRKPKGEYNCATRVRHSWRSDGSESLRIARSDGSLVEASLGPDQVLRISAADRPTCGEFGADSVAWRLVDRLKMFGGTWSRPESSTEPGIDSTVSGPDGLLKIQVTRAFSDPSAWQELARDLELHRSFSVSDGIDVIWRAVLRKACSTPRSSRRAITLALDTAAPGILAFIGVMVPFREGYAERVQELGFNQVWLVGPIDHLTWRVDVPFPPGQRVIGI